MEARLLGSDVLAADDEVDTKYHEITGELYATLREDGTRIDELLPIMFISKHIERIADHATNIAEDAIYMVDGDIVRHGRHHGTREVNPRK